MKLKLTKVNIFLLLFVLFLIISWLGGMLSMYTTSFQSTLTLDKEKKSQLGVSIWKNSIYLPIQNVE